MLSLVDVRWRFQSGPYLDFHECKASIGFGPLGKNRNNLAHVLDSRVNVPFAGVRSWNPLLIDICHLLLLWFWFGIATRREVVIACFGYLTSEGVETSGTAFKLG